MSEKTTVRLKLDPLIAIRNLRPKQIRVTSLDPKHTEGVNLHPPKVRRTPSHLYPSPRPRTAKGKS